MKKIFQWVRKKLGIGRSKKSDISKLINEKIGLLEEFLGFQINHREYFVKALTHRSFLELSDEIEKSNERLEFLGDSVLNLIAGEYLFLHFPDEGEGFLTKSRSHLVRREALADASEVMQLHRFLLYDKRFLKGSDEGMRTVMADALEALTGAIYMDKGLEGAKEFLLEYVIRPFLIDGRYQEDTNFKGQLLEYTHANNFHPPSYKIIKEQGPDHDKIFTVEVIIGEDVRGIGAGKNKKSAEQDAAKDILDKLINEK